MKIDLEGGKSEWLRSEMFALSLMRWISNGMFAFYQTMTSMMTIETERGKFTRSRNRNRNDMLHFSYSNTKFHETNC